MTTAHTCESCGAEIDSEDDLEVESVPVLTDVSKRRVTVGADRRDLWLCKQCGATLGVADR
ncbi:hypothetical protein ACNS7O_12640 [Haloferacaceae archaeon DSL9]